MAANPNPLRLFASYLSPTARAHLRESLHRTCDLTPEKADAVLSVVLDHFLQLRSSSVPHTRDPLARQARLNNILQLLKGGATTADIARTMGLSAPRVSQLIADARAQGVDIPARTRGRPVATSQKAAEVLRLLQQGYHSLEIVRMLQISAAALHRLVKVLRSRGESVPDPYEVDAWRTRWDYATYEALTAIHKYNGYDELADMLQVNQAKREVVHAELRADAKAKAKAAKNIEQSLPAHVVTVPPEPVREAAQQVLRKEAVAPTPKPTPNAHMKPAVPYALRPNLLPTSTTLKDRLDAAATSTSTSTSTPTPSPSGSTPRTGSAPSLQDILATLAAKVQPKTP